MEKSVASRYQAMQAELYALFAKMDQTQPSLRNQRPEGAWNSVQILQHLLLSEGGTVAYVNKKLNQSPENVAKAGLAAKLRSFALNRALRNFRKKYKAPGTVGDVDDAPDYEAIKARYLDVRKDLKETLEKFDAERTKRCYFKHPVAGTMSILQALDFMHEHFVRHRAQIEERSRPY